MAKQKTGNLGEQSKEFHDDAAKIETSQGKVNLGVVKETAASELLENNGAELVKSNSEVDDINRQEIIDEIKKAKNESVPRYYIEELFESEKLEGKEIPVKYRQQIVDEIGASGACSYVIVTHPERFEGTTIEKCVLNAVKQGELLDDYCIQLMISWKPFNYIQLLEGMLAIKLNNNSQGDEKSNDFKDNMRELLTHYLSYMWKGLRGVEENVYKNIPDMILESDYYIFLPELLENGELKDMHELTDEFYGDLADKLINNYENLDNQYQKKLEEYLLKKNPYVFLEKVNKLPKKLLVDEKILKMLDTGSLSSLDGKSINIDTVVFDKYANRLVETGNWRIIIRKSEYFKGKIDFLDKIKKIFKYEKEQRRPLVSVFEIMCSLDLEEYVDMNQLAKICEEEGIDIKNYPRIFGKVLYDRDPENIKLILDTFDSYQNYNDGYMVITKKRNGDSYDLYGFVKDGEIIFDGYEWKGFYKAYQEYETNKGA